MKVTKVRECNWNNLKTWNVKYTCRYKVKVNIAGIMPGTSHNMHELMFVGILFDNTE